MTQWRVDGYDSGNVMKGIRSFCENNCVKIITAEEVGTVIERSSYYFCVKENSHGY